MTLHKRTHEMESMPSICIGHLDESVAQKLVARGDKNPWLTCAPYGHGLFLNMDTLPDSEIMPKCLLDIKRWAKSRTNPFTWVMLVAGSPQEPTLTHYTW